MLFVGRVEVAVALGHLRHAAGRQSVTEGAVGEAALVVEGVRSVV